MKSHVLGIDLGTTNSVVAVADGKQARVLATEAGGRLLPSVVAFEADGSVTVGEAARERRLVDAANTAYSVKRLIGRPYDSPEVARAQQRFAFQLERGANGAVVIGAHGQLYSLTEISAHVLGEAKRVAEAALAVPCERAVVTVPANFNELQRSATKAAGRVAGLEVIRILNEPTAAALAYGYGAEASSRVAVYDLGGGTFDLTVLELESDVFEVLATAGDSFLGGDDLDLAVAEAMADACAELHAFDPRADAQAFERVRAAAEWAKCELSGLETVALTLEEFVPEIDGPGGDFHFEMSRAELVALTRPILLRTFDVCRRALAEAGLERRGLDAVILVGGATRMPLVREMVGQFFGKTPRTDLDPDLVVAQGAAIHGFAIGGRQGPPPPPPPPPRPKSPFTVAALRRAQAKRAASREVERKQPAFAPAPPPPPPEALAASFALDLPPAPPPLLMDVTPHALGISTVGGLSEVLIRRNAPIPCEERRTFSPAVDGQTDVILHIFQGEARLAADNEPLGSIELTGLRPSKRGETVIEVSFLIDASGTLDVRAVDLATKAAQSIRINLIAGAADEVEDAARARHEAAQKGKT